MRSLIALEAEEEEYNKNTGDYLAAVLLYTSADDDDDEDEANP